MSTLILPPSNSWNDDPLVLAEIAQYLDRLDELDDTALLELGRLAEALAALETKAKLQTKFIDFVKKVWPSFIEGYHHKVVAKLFEEIAEGRKKRVIICMPPRHTKSEFASYLFPAWFIGRYPNKKIIQATHTAELSVNFGRKVRDLIGTKEYQEVFPAVSLKSDTKAAGRWNTSVNGEYWSVGVGAALAGKGADLFIIDDPHSEQEGMSVEQKSFEKAYDWYTSGPRQRLQPNGSIVIVMCMTGDTRVLMADGTEKALAWIKPGDRVKTYDRGSVTESVVANHRSNGYDSTYEIRMRSGGCCRANARHPFLVGTDRGEEWVRLRDLRPGMALVRVTGIGGERSASPMAALRRSWRRGCAEAITRRLAGPLVTGAGVRRLHAKPGSSTGTASPWLSMKRWFLSKVAYVLSAVSRRATGTPGPTGPGSSVSTTATRVAGSGGCSATTATLRSDTGRLSEFFSPLRSTYGIATDEIVEIVPVGQEEVFDVEIVGTENFIANGCVSHNTRWNKGDLVGRILKKAAEEGDDEWELVELPAILPSGKPIWPEYWSVEELLKVKRDIQPHKWNAQYQQSPSGEEGSIIKKEWWRRWEDAVPPKVNFVIQSWDTAFTSTSRSDYSAVTTWGVFTKEDESGRLRTNIILLDSKKARVEFPDLKQMAKEEWKHWNPDLLIVEGRSSGLPLIFELRAMGIPVQSYTPTAGQDKIMRVNGVADLFSSGIVWVPERRFSDELIEEFSEFPNGIHDDLVDSATQALMRFRQGGFIRLRTDEDWDAERFEPVDARYY